MFVSLFLSLYLSTLMSFSFVTHPVGYCLLLLFSAFSFSGFVYLYSGVVWYLVLFCLVYVGGVYVLFVFVSLQDPNPVPASSGGKEVVGVLFFTLVCSFLGAYFGSNISVNSDCSHYLCACFEAGAYLFFCAVLLIGFTVLSTTAGIKDSFFR